MSNAFLDQLCAAVLREPLIHTADQRRLIGRAIADTLAVAAAGFPEPVTRNFISAYDGNGASTWSGERCESAEAAILINAVAAHALDFDDVYIESMAHISTVLLPAVFRGGDDNPDDVLDAFAAGLVAAKAVARRVGRGHYYRGWHGTGTIGTFAAAAACGRLNRLTPNEMAHAFAMAASMSGGLQANFSTQTKPAHAGFAAAAGFRAARLAAAGVTGSRAIFSSEKGYPALYGAGDGEQNPTDDAFELRPDLISMKLYPCCYASHRLVGIALDARDALGEAVVSPSIRYRLSVPAGSIGLLKHDRPRNGMEAKFSATYPFAVALLRGTPTLADFYDAAVTDAAVTEVMNRLEVVEDTSQPSGGDIEYGEVTLTLEGFGGPERTFRRTALPGSPLDPPKLASLKAKFAACLDDYKGWSGAPFPILAHADKLGGDEWLPAGMSRAVQELA